MTEPVTFDYVNLIITEVDTGLEQNEIDVLDIYSSWKRDQLDFDRLGYPPAFRTVGGDPISENQQLGLTYFALNNWKFRPAEYDHTVILVGNWIPDPTTNDLFAPTVGNFTVLIQQQVSNLTDASVANLNLNQLLQEIYVDAVRGRSIADARGDTASLGTPTDPVNNAADAKTLAQARNLYAFAVRGALDVPFSADPLTDLNIRGLSAQFNDVLSMGNINVIGAQLNSVTVTGVTSGAAEWRACTLDLLTGLEGLAYECALRNDILIADGGKMKFNNCYAGSTEVASIPRVKFVNTGAALLQDYVGVLDIEDMQTGCVVNVDILAGEVTVKASCTGGSLSLRGQCRLTIETGAVLDQIDIEGLVETSEYLDAIKSLVGNARITNSDQEITVYADDNVTVRRVLSVSADGRIRAIA